MKNSAKQTVLFVDGSCPLCQAEINFYCRRDTTGALTVVNVAAPGAPLPASLDRAGAMARFHVLTGEGQLLSGAAAFAEVWKQLPGWRSVGRLAGLPAISSVLELGYRMFLVLRPAFVRAFEAARRIKAIGRISTP